MFSAVRAMSSRLTGVVEEEYVQSVANKFFLNLSKRKIYFIYQKLTKLRGPLPFRLCLRHNYFDFLSKHFHKLCKKCPHVWQVKSIQIIDFQNLLPSLPYPNNKFVLVWRLTKSLVMSLLAKDNTLT
uniref:(northern house mosquito) hypothetical protein n=1 Tax=Culex pipiens TaxID=7175 RepID=A0A8D8F8Z8_CULPI